jgi:hypothetical protein
MNVQEIPRTIVERGLDIARFPIDTVTRWAGGDERWTIAVDRLESSVRETAGRLLNDDALVGDARLQRREAAEREKALELKARAEMTERRGEQQAKTVEARAERAQQAERERAERRDQEIERTERAAERATIAKKAAALDAKEKALRTKATAQRLDDAADAVKAARKSK